MLTTQNTLLHLIDVQDRLFNVMFNKELLLDNMIKLIKGINVLEIPVVWIEQYPQGLGKTVPEISELLSGYETLEKITFSSCQTKGMSAKFEKSKKTNILVMGIECHVCVYQTVRDLLTEGYQVYLVADAVSSRTAENYELGLKAMQQLGARVTSVEMALFELLKQAGSNEFKQISRIIK